MMKRFLFITMLYFLALSKVAYAEDCGLRTINLKNEQSIIAVQECIKNALTELNASLTNQKEVAESTLAKAKDIIAEESECIRMEQYYNDAQTSHNYKNADLYKSRVHECYAILQMRSKEMDKIGDDYQYMKGQTENVEALINVLQSKYDSLSRQLTFLQ